MSRNQDFWMSRSQDFWNASKIKECAYKAHEMIEKKYEKGQTEMFKDERFVQYIVYVVFCERFGISKPDHAVLEYPAP